MSDSGVREVPFAGTRVAVGYAGETAKRIVDFLYSDLYSDLPDGDGLAPDVQLAVDTKARGRLSLFQGEKQLYKGDSPGALANILIGETIHHLADRSDGGTVFHAGAVCRNGCGVILPGQTGSGKTTFTAWLLRAGLNYLTDELVYIKEGSDSLHSFTRPLNVKTPALSLLRDELGLDPTQHKTLRCPQATLVPHRLFNPVHEGYTPTLRLILFPEYKKDCSFTLTKLSQAQAGLRLMGCLVNARNLVGHGFQEVTRLSRTTPAYAVEYGCFQSFEGELTKLLDAVLS